MANLIVKAEIRDGSLKFGIKGVNDVGFRSSLDSILDKVSASKGERGRIETGGFLGFAKTQIGVYSPMSETIFIVSYTAELACAVYDCLQNAGAIFKNPGTIMKYMSEHLTPEQQEALSQSMLEQYATPEQLASPPQREQGQ